MSGTVEARLAPTNTLEANIGQKKGGVLGFETPTDRKLKMYKEELKKIKEKLSRDKENAALKSRAKQLETEVKNLSNLTNFDPFKSLFEPPKKKTTTAAVAQTGTETAEQPGRLSVMA